MRVGEVISLVAATVLVSTLTLIAVLNPEAFVAGCAAASRSSYVVYRSRPVVCYVW